MSFDFIFPDLDDFFKLQDLAHLASDVLSFLLIVLSSHSQDLLLLLDLQIQLADIFS